MPNLPSLKARKGKEKITVLSLYDYTSAKLLDGAVDMFLVGDSLGMVVYGLDSTLPVTLDMMIAHGRAVARGASESFVVVDLPFGSYQESPAQAFANSARVMIETGAKAVKLEGGTEMAETVAFLVARSIPVMGHVGLRPQSVNAYGGFRVQGRTAEAAEQVLADARAMEAAGCFSIVVEGVTRALADRVTAEVSIPVIGIGASPACDGQVLVLSDLLGMAERPAKFVKCYADLRSITREAVQAYADEIRAGTFPSADHCY
ncbi:3-methyl-2-oxobutanoate hydroxymethyltransferase [Enterovirga sp. CN4-39]